jgi:hypothetical protein
MSENIINQLYGSFTVIGTPHISKVEGKYHTTGKSKEGYEWHKLNWSVDTGINGVKNNIFLEFMGGMNTLKPNVIKTIDKEKKKIDVSWSDRFEKSIIDTVADYRKYKVTLASSDYNDYKIFLSESDVVNYLLENLAEDKRVMMTGNFKMERYKKDGVYQYIMKYMPSTIRLAKDEEPNKAELRLGFVFGQDSWDEGRLKDEKKVDISAYFPTYDKELDKTIFLPLQLILNCEKLDLQTPNPQHKSIFDYVKGCFTKHGKKYMETEWECQIVKSVEQEEVTMDDLSDNEKTQISIGMYTFEEIAKKKQGAFGARLNELRLLKPTNKYDGDVNNETEYTDDDFITEVINAVETKEDLFGNDETKVDNPVDMKGLFGN